MLRQPVRTLLLVLLIAAASFAFVLRAVEFIVVRERIAEISGFFRSVGVLSHRDGIETDVTDVIEYIAGNRYVADVDMRRGFEANLDGMTNAYIEGSRLWQAEIAYEYYRDEFWAREYVALRERHVPRDGFAGFVSGDSFFYGEVTDIRFVPVNPWVWGFAEFEIHPHVLIYVVVDEAVLGYPERLFAGQTVRLRVDDYAFDGVEIGGRYFFHGRFYYMLGRLQRDSRQIVKFLQSYAPAAPEECQVMEYARHAQSAVYLRTTRDMTRMPFAQEALDVIFLREGRFIDHDDYLNARPVVVVNRRFAERRRVGIGDTVTLRVGSEQHLVYSPYYLIGNPDDLTHPLPVTLFPELGVLSPPGGVQETVTLELEVVGIFDMFRRRLVSIDWSSANKFMYVPDSLLPADWGLADGTNPMIWFSFTLHDQRDQAAFLWDTRETLAQHGFRVNFLGRDGSGFWAVSDIIMMSTVLNLAMFSAVLALVLALVAALFIWQRGKEFAILRSLGCPVRDVFLQSSAALMFFGLPSVVAGSVAGWFYSVRISENAVAGFGEIIADAIGIRLLPSERAALIASYTETALPHIAWLAALCAVVFGTLLLFVTIGNIRGAKKSVLETLQGAK